MKLTRQAQVLIFTFMIGIFLITAFLLFKPSEEQNQENKTDQYTVQLVGEDVKLQSTYIDSISIEKSSTNYVENKIVLEKGQKVGDYILSSEQTFIKYIKLLGPDEKQKLIKGSKNIMTHYAYTMLLSGDVIEKTNTTTKEKTYEVVNAHITYQQIPLTLLSDNNNVAIANQKKTKEKIVNLQEFINALKDIEKREQMLTW
ncbi:hypothetical protein [Candidatus Stoquefichus massiliensis]|uniref:hypothetical protein n=1 Tax=Candidatus Stoquefichus massiliensis TaxID=1470350 RepID=UPI00047F8249|nr:hypothetical protein [Candidatus Stoquefichus massiliensis]